MKCIFLLCVLLPFVFGTPKERFLPGVLLSPAQILSLLTEKVEGFAYPGQTQSECVTACGTAVPTTGLALYPLCPLACHNVLSKLK